MVREVAVLVGVHRPFQRGGNQRRWASAAKDFQRIEFGPGRNTRPNRKLGKRETARIDTRIGVAVLPEQTAATGDTGHVGSVPPTVHRVRVGLGNGIAADGKAVAVTGEIVAAHYPACGKGESSHHIADNRRVIAGIARAWPAEVFVQIVDARVNDANRDCFACQTARVDLIPERGRAQKGDRTHGFNRMHGQGVNRKHTRQGANLGDQGRIHVEANAVVDPLGAVDDLGPGQGCCGQQAVLGLIDALELALGLERCLGSACAGQTGSVDLRGGVVGQLHQNTNGFRRVLLAGACGDCPARAKQQQGYHPRARQPPHPA